MQSLKHTIKEIMHSVICQYYFTTGMPFMLKCQHHQILNLSNQGFLIFSGWLQENNHEPDFENLGVDVLNERLRVFYASLRTKKGTEYSRSALLGIRAAISRHLTSPPFSRQISIMSDRAFMSSNHVMLGLIKIRKREGKDVTEHKQAGSEGDV